MPAAPVLTNLNLTTRVVWNPVSDPAGISHYAIYRNGVLALNWGASTPQPAYDNDRPLDPCTTYSYTVTAVDNNGLEGPPSNAMVVSTGANIANGTNVALNCVNSDIAALLNSIGTQITALGAQLTALEAQVMTLEAQVAAIGVKVNHHDG